MNRAQTRNEAAYQRPQIQSESGGTERGHFICRLRQSLGLMNPSRYASHSADRGTDRAASPEFIARQIASKLVARRASASSAMRLLRISAAAFETAALLEVNVAPLFPKEKRLLFIGRFLHRASLNNAVATTSISGNFRLRAEQGRKTRAARAPASSMTWRPRKG